MGLGEKFEMLRKMRIWLTVVNEWCGWRKKQKRKANV